MTPEELKARAGEVLADATLPELPNHQPARCATITTCPTGGAS